MATKARDAMGTTELADRGYFKSEEILASHEAGITVFVARSETSNATADGRFLTREILFTMRSMTNTDVLLGSA